MCVATGVGGASNPDLTDKTCSITFLGNKVRYDPLPPALQYSL